ncbi:hypothetical protein, partial [Acidianus sp. RZ1]
MEDFREIILNTVLSSKITNYNDVYRSGLRKRNMCYFFDGTFCKIKMEENIVNTWKSNNKTRPHPVLCYICPYFSIRENDGISNSSLFDIYSYYIKLKESIE